MRRQTVRFCTAATAAFYPQWQWRHVGLLRELSFFGGGLLICFVIKLGNIQAVNYVETTVEWEQ